MILPGWQVVSFPPFNAKWERSLKVHVTRENYSGFFNMDQRIVQANPFSFHIQTLKYDWDTLLFDQGVHPQPSTAFAQRLFRGQERPQRLG